VALTPGGVDLVDDGLKTSGEKLPGQEFSVGKAVEQLENNRIL
jgi:hypothetical protein